MTTIPAKLKAGDEIRVISPSRSLSLISESVIDIACDRLTDLGLNISFAKHAREIDTFDSSSIKSRVQDLHDAFRDKKIKAIITAFGGFNANQILKYLDYDLIKNNPKIFCGYSDITALSNAIYAKTGLVTYSGPHFSTFGMVKGMEYTLEYFTKCLFSSEKFEIKPSAEWSDDAWYLDQNKRKFITNKGFTIIQPGTAEGTIVGGNLCTFNLLHGTEFMPLLKNTILFIEDDEMCKAQTDIEFDRNLQSILHLPGADKIKGLVIGRFQKASMMTDEKLKKIIQSKKELKNTPVVANVDFGHTSPYLTFPIGGRVGLVVKKNNTVLKILKH